jgi:hypothetical protein
MVTQLAPPCPSFIILQVSEEAPVIDPLLLTSVYLAILRGGAVGSFSAVSTFQAFSLPLWVKRCMVFLDININMDEEYDIFGKHRRTGEASDRLD